MNPSLGILDPATKLRVNGFSQLLNRLAAGRVLDVDNVESGRLQSLLGDQHGQSGSTQTMKQHYVVS